ncbi:MAG: hypothetical protein AAFX76_11310, partial [Planctomycetota bacterium]
MVNERVVRGLSFVFGVSVAPRRLHAGVWAALAATAGMLSGCFSLYDKPVYPKKGQPAEVYVSPVSISRWEDYRAQLQPSFELDAQQAYDRVLANSLLTRRSATRSSRFELSADLAGAGGGAEAPSTDTASLDRARAERPESADLSFDGQSPAVDAMLQYWTAAALFQEVQIINRIVNDLTASKDKEAFLVRIQLSTLPYSRKSPLDTYIDVEITKKPTERKTTDTDQATAIEAIERGWATHSVQDVGLAIPDAPDVTEDSPTKDGQAAAGTKAPDDRVGAVEVYPLLIADNIELSGQRRTAREVQEIALALGAVVQNVGVTAGYGVYQEIAQAALGQDYNSLLTVSKSGTNSVRVRLGALNSPTTRFAMVPRNHYVSFLVVVSKNKVKDPNQPQGNAEGSQQALRETDHAGDITTQLD